MLLLIDNLDSFTYNIVDAFRRLGEKVLVRRSHFTTIEECCSLRFDSIVIGPGPKAPSQAGISKECIEKFGKKIPLLGICLGHQAIGESFGGTIVKAKMPIHGKKEKIFHTDTGIFHSLSSPIEMARYHSLVVERKSLPPSLEITAETEEGEIMGLRHREYLIEGVQFHPESILSEKGYLLLENFLRLK